MPNNVSSVRAGATERLPIDNPSRVWTREVRAMRELALHLYGPLSQLHPDELDDLVGYLAGPRRTSAARLHDYAR